MKFMLIVRRHIIIFIKRNIKEGGFKYIIKLLMDFYKDKSFGEVLEVLGLEEKFVFMVEMVFLNIVPLVVDFITITAYILHVIDGYIGLIIIAIVVIHIWTELAKNFKLFWLY